jgi:hypothetical protein
MIIGDESSGSRCRRNRLFESFENAVNSSPHNRSSAGATRPTAILIAPSSLATFSTAPPDRTSRQLIVRLQTGEALECGTVADSLNGRAGRGHPMRPKSQLCKISTTVL